MRVSLSRAESKSATNAIVLSGFPGIGKSSAFKQFPDSMADSDSSKFPKEGFPANYIEHIQGLLTQKKYILVSSHQEVRDAMRAAGIAFTCVFPDRSCKDEYMERYKERGSPEGFLNLLDKQWDNFIDGCEAEPNQIKMHPGAYLTDVLQFIEDNPGHYSF